MLSRVAGWLRQRPAIYGPAVRTYQMVAQTRREHQVRRYLRTHEQRLLRIGAGRHTDPGWLSVDLIPLPRSGVVFMDATKPFPFADGTFDAIQAEHMIEHVPYAAGVAMMRECHRVLRKGGTLRILTPDLQLVRRLLDTSDRDPALTDYVAWSNRTYGASAGETDPANVAFTVNRLMRAWGHEFIYDEPTLRQALTSASFSAITVVRPGESTHPELRGVDRHGEEIGAAFNRLETLALEATA